MRYKNKFRYLIDIPEDMMSLTVLKITLQPLVENAIYHGIRSVDYEGLIEISGRMEGEDILLMVRDNGLGMDVDKLASLLNSEGHESASGDGPRNEGTGVRNVHERIRLYFGKDYGLEYKSNAGGGQRLQFTCLRRGGINCEIPVYFHRGTDGRSDAVPLPHLLHGNRQERYIGTEKPIVVVVKATVAGQPMKFWSVVQQGINEAAKESALRC